jgi:hypothetical protein
MMDLMREIIAKHEELGASSPLNNNSVIDMADFKAKFLEADALRKEGIMLAAEAKSKMDQARKIMGTNPGQTVNTDGTLFYKLTDIKKYLLFKYNGVEEVLSEYGFNIVVRNAVGVGRPKKKKK